MSKLQAEYWDAQDKILKEVGISLKKKKKKKKVDKNQTVECLVCCDDVSTEIPFCHIIFQHNIFSLHPLLLRRSSSRKHVLWIVAMVPTALIAGVSISA